MSKHKKNLTGWQLGLSRALPHSSGLFWAFPYFFFNGDVAKLQATANDFLVESFLKDDLLIPWMESKYSKAYSTSTFCGFIFQIKRKLLSSSTLTYNYLTQCLNLFPHQIMSWDNCRSTRISASRNNKDGFLMGTRFLYLFCLNKTKKENSPLLQC